MAAGGDGRLRVVVLMGGCSSEREISLLTGEKVARALDPDRYTALPIVVNDHRRFLQSTASRRMLPVSASGPAEAVDAGCEVVAADRAHGNGAVDVVFIAMHGAFGEDGTLQALLDLLGIPYTGSGVLASALAMDKAMAKRIFASADIPTPPHRLFPTRDLPADGSDLWPALTGELGAALVVKPNAHGSSVAVSIVRSREELGPALRAAAACDDAVLIERYIGGTEISVGILGNEDPEALPVVEIVPCNEFYDYEAKYTPGATEEICPARIPAPTAERAQELALAAHKALGCRGMSRVDMILSAEEIWVLEVNTIPGMTETSLLPFAARTVGIEFSELVDRLVRLALAR